MGRKLNRKKTRAKQRVQEFIDEHGVDPQKWLHQWAAAGWPETMSNIWISQDANMLLPIPPSHPRKSKNHKPRH